ncbi:MAG: calcium-binding protein [Synechococcus sp.]|nr:calcium-binding protein [Synechococcus sp.]
MAFATVQGAGQLDFIGTPEIDVLVAVNLAQPSYTGGQDNDDSITFNQFETGVTRNATVRGGKGNDAITSAFAVATSQIFGDDGDDTVTLTGNISTSLISLGLGNDIFNPGAVALASMNAVTLNGNDGADAINLAGAFNIANTKILGGPQNDTLNIGSGAAVAISNSSFNGNNDDDTLNINTGATSVITNVTFFGGDGNDTINAAAALQVGSVGFLLSGDLGDDNVTGSALDDTILLGAGNDTSLGGAGKDTITGGDGNDTIDGQTGSSNTIIGQGGADDYNGVGAGTVDTFVIEAISNSAATTSGTTRGFDRFLAANAFNSGVDKLDLKAVASTLAGGPVNGATVTTNNFRNVASANNFAELKTALDASGIVGSNNATIQVTRVNVAAGTLTGTYLWINDNQASYNTGDLMFQTAAINQIVGGSTDIVLV